MCQLGNVKRRMVNYLFNYFLIARFDEGKPQTFQLRIHLQSSNILAIPLHRSHRAFHVQGHEDGGNILVALLLLRTICL